MALATRCPNCQSTFRVVADQLKLRGGLVRCGSCRQVFDAISTLTYVDDQALAGVAATGDEEVAARRASSGESAAASQLPAAGPAHRTPAAEAGSRRPEPAGPPDTDAQRGVDRDAGRVAEPQRGRAPAAGAAPDAAPDAGPTHAPARQAPPEAPAPAPIAARVDGDASVGAAGATPAPAARPAAAAEEERAAREAARVGAETILDSGDALALQPPTVIADAPFAHLMDGDATPAEPAPGTRGAAGAKAGTGAGRAVDERPAFLRTDHPPRFSVVFGGGSLLLGLLLLAQFAVGLRMELVNRWPELRPALATLCHAFGCSVGLPTRADQLAVLGTELQTLPNTDVLELTTVIRNRAGFTVALPAIEVTLSDTLGRIVARKVFTPADYLAASGEPSSRIAEGLGAGTDYTIRIAFEARGMTAVGFVVYPFYL